MEKTKLAYACQKGATSTSPRRCPIGGYYQSRKGVMAKKHFERTSSITIRSILVFYCRKERKSK